MDVQVYRAFIGQLFVWVNSVELKSWIDWFALLPGLC